MRKRDYADQAVPAVRRLLRTGRVRGYVGHHINSVNGSQELAGEPNNIRFVQGQTENLELHGGDFRNPTKGELIGRSEMMNNSLAVLSIIQLVGAEVVKVAETNITGVYEGWSFRNWMPNPDALFLEDPAKAAVTLDGFGITVFGPKGASADYTIRGGNYYQTGSDKPVDPSAFKGAEFTVKPGCIPDRCS